MGYPKYYGCVSKQFKKIKNLSIVKSICFNEEKTLLRNILVVQYILYPNFNLAIRLRSVAVSWIKARRGKRRCRIRHKHGVKRFSGLMDRRLHV